MDQSRQVLSLRQTEILDIARDAGKVTVEGLALRLQVTAQTIRRDLKELAGAGELARVHGGAVVPPLTRNIDYAERHELNFGAKQAIARRCVQDIPDASSIFLNIGTTTEAVADHLRQHRGLKIITNNINVGAILRGHDCDIAMTGGTLRHSDGALIGDLALPVVEQYKADFAVIGASALDADGDLLDYDHMEALVTRAFMRQSREVFLVVDKSKFTRTAPIRVASLREVTHLYHDGALPEAIRRRALDWEVATVACDPA